MRQSFISPTFLPVVSECVLRDDFNFHNYLSKATHKTINYIFEINNYSVYVLILTGIIWLYFNTFSYGYYAICTLPLFAALISLWIRSDLEKIYEMLVYDMKGPY